MSGIYSILNTVTKRQYIGSSINLERRKNTHFRDLQKNSHPNQYLQNAVNKYGLSNFIFNVLEECRKEDLLKREQEHLDKYNHVYNLSPLATGSIGQNKSVKTREKISRSLKKKNVMPPSRQGVGYGFCKLYCSNGHYKTTLSLIHGSNSCKECQRIKSQVWRQTHRV